MKQNKEESDKTKTSFIVISITNLIESLKEVHIPINFDREFALVKTKLDEACLWAKDLEEKEKKMWKKTEKK